MEQSPHVPTSASRFPGYEAPPPAIEIPTFTRAEPADWFYRHWKLLALLVVVGAGYASLTASVNGKLDREEYAKDQAVRETIHARENATRDSIAGQTLTEVQRIGRALCRKDPGAC